MKLSKATLKRIILEEIEKMMDEDSLLDPPQIGEPGYVDYKQGSMCEQCGASMYYEGQCMKCGYIMMEGSCCDHSDGCGCADVDDGSDYSIDSMIINQPDHHHNNNYMAKKQLYKISKYAQKLHDMIPDGYELDDWQRSHLSSIADDISEVYHSLDYDMFKGEI